MKKNLKAGLLNFIRIIAAPVILIAFAAAVFAFIEPTAAPPGGIVYPPINTSGTAQTKSGNFTSSGVITGNIMNATSQMCLGGSCITSWPSGGGGGLSGSGSANYVSKWTGGASLGNSQIYDNGSNVGIGTTGPNEKLEVSGNLFVSSFGKFGNLSAVNNGIGFWGASKGVLVGADNGVMVGIGLGGNGNTGMGVSSGNTPYGSVGLNGGDGNFWVSAHGRKLILGSGYGVITGDSVGIGTSYPSAKLDVQGGNVRIGRLYVGDQQYGTNAPGIGTNGWDVGAVTNGVFAAARPWGGYAPVYAQDYWINAVGKWASQLGGGGSVGGNSTSLANGKLCINDEWDNVVLRRDCSWYWWMAYQRSTGNIGLVNGNAWLWSNGDYQKTSDIRLKNNITPISGSLEKLGKINGVSFEWNSLSNASGAKGLGVIAQDVETVFPELVVDAPNTGYKTLNYDGLIAPLIEAVKELKAENDSLKARIEVLEAR